MKREALRDGTVSRVWRSSFAAMIALVGLLVCPALGAGGGNIFDDDWTPPKPAVRPAVPAQPAAVAPNPAPPDPHPAAAPPATAQPAALPQPQAPSRRAIPGKMEQARSRGLLKEAFATQLKDRTIAGRKKLAQTLLDEVPKAADNPSDEFVLLGGAIEASKEAGTLRLCFSAADTMAAQYDVDALTVKTEAVLKVNLRGDSPATAAENVRAALELVDPLVAAEDFATALRILAQARPAAASDPSLLPVVQKRIAIVESLRAAHDRLAVFVEKLKTSPDDPALNLAVGSYTCFNKSEWEKGLPMLAKGSDPNLKQLAALELSRPTKPDDVMRLGDGWWDFGVKQPDAIRGEIYKHSADIYNVALPSVTGLRRTMMEHRIADASVDQTASRKTVIAVAHHGPNVFINSIGMKFVRIEPGTFMMGSPPEETDHQENETLHRVKITKPFLMAITTVTQAQWKTVMGNNPSQFQGDNRPVEMVSWNDSVAFCQKLSAKEGGKRYRLPTEAEWEYACRAGTQTAYSFGDGKIDDFAWYNGNAGLQTHDVATKKPNPWGLYDMDGNVIQRCSDGYGPYGGDAVDPKGADGSLGRVIRGGSWNSYPRDSRAARRQGQGTGWRGGSVGIRVCMDF